MGRGNDAVPSWSGYNYQGKISLLATLIEMNTLLSHNKVISDKHYIELEKNEDFILFIDDNALLFQIKAYLSSAKFTTYHDAIKKLNEHSQEFSNYNTTRYLCTLLDIQDWNSPSNTYLSLVNLYKPFGECVSLEAVPTLIEDEIKKLLQHHNKPITYSRQAYLELCSYLDKKISEMHLQPRKVRQYTISFNEILHLVTEKSETLLNNEEAKNKEKIYEYVVQNCKSIIDEHCELICELKESNSCFLDLGFTCPLLQSYDYMLAMNFWEYAKYLRPEITNWENPLSLVEYITKETLAEILIPVVKVIPSSNLFQEENIIFHGETPSFVRSGVTVPTLLSLRAGLHGIRTVEQKLQKIAQNHFITSSLGGKSITAETDTKSYDTVKDRILYFANDEIDKTTDNNYDIKITDEVDKTTANNSGIKIIDCSDFINNFQENYYDY